VPFKIDAAKKHLWGGERFSSDVVAYTRAVAKAFKASEFDERWAEDKIKSERRKQFAYGAVWVLGG
jgi:hypothetical protein